MILGDRIRFFRKLHGMTMKSLGQRIGFSEKTADIRVSQYENGSRKPKEALITQLADIFDVSVHALNIPNIDDSIGIMHTLFALEDMEIFEIKELDKHPCLVLNKNVRDKAPLLVDSFHKWFFKSMELKNGEISKKDYDNWRYKFSTNKHEVKKVCERCNEEIVGAGLYCSCCGKALF